MKYLIILIFTIYSSATEDSYIEVPCNAFNEVFMQLQGIGKKCEVDSNIHVFEQKISENIAGIILYDDGEEVPFNTVDNIFKSNIEAGRQFVFKVGMYVSVPLKLFLNNDGSESWRYKKQSTNRWNKYKFEPIDVSMVETGIRIVSNDEKKPIPNIIIQLVTEAMTYEHKTDAKGEVRIYVNKDIAFEIKAFNIFREPIAWDAYPNKMKISKMGKTYECIDSEWVISKYDLGVRSLER